MAGRRGGGRVLPAGALRAQPDRVGRPGPAAAPVSDSQKWLMALAVIAVGVAATLLAAVLTPFAVAAMLAYLGDPLVRTLQRWRLPRGAAVLLVFALLGAAVAVLLLVLVPLVARQFQALVALAPHAIDWVQRALIEPAARWSGLPSGQVDLHSLRGVLSEHWRQAGGLLVTGLRYVTSSGSVLVDWLLDVLLVPVVTYYLMRDWPAIMRRGELLVPAGWRASVVAAFTECDRVLAQFLRGQLSVMLALACVYSGGLWLVGIRFALLIGMLAGALSFIPYLGLAIGVVLGASVAWFQYGALAPVLYVLLVFGVGQLLEGTVLTPRLVGERIGLHPVAVLFAVLAGGRLFGFLGVVLALPVAAVVLVLLRRAHRRYVSSAMYRG